MTDDLKINALIDQDGIYYLETGQQVHVACVQSGDEAKIFVLRSDTEEQAQDFAKDLGSVLYIERLYNMLAKAIQATEVISQKPTTLL